MLRETTVADHSPPSGHGLPRGGHRRPTPYEPFQLGRGLGIYDLQFAQFCKKINSHLTSVSARGSKAVAMGRHASTVVPRAATAGPNIQRSVGSPEPSCQTVPGHGAQLGGDVSVYQEESASAPAIPSRTGCRTSFQSLSANLPTTRTSRCSKVTRYSRKQEGACSPAPFQSEIS
jgi:hypothetical protein